MTVACIKCGRDMPHRWTKDGYPRGSIYLRHMDKAYLFCTVDCAARYGIERAMTNTNHGDYQPRKDFAAADNKRHADKLENS